MGFQHFTKQRRIEIARKGGFSVRKRYLDPAKASEMGKAGAESREEHMEDFNWNCLDNTAAKIAGHNGGKARWKKSAA